MVEATQAAASENKKQNKNNKFDVNSLQFSELSDIFLT